MLDVPPGTVGLSCNPRSALSPRSQQSLFRLPAFRGLGEAERQRVAGLFGEIALAKGETIYEAGDVADALYLVVSGAVDVVDGAEVVARYGPEEVFGEAVLVPGEQRAVTTRVALDAVLLVLPRGSLDYLFELHPSLHQRVSVLLGRRLKQVLNVARGRKTRPSEIVVLEGWTSAAERRDFVELSDQVVGHNDIVRQQIDNQTGNVNSSAPDANEPVSDLDRDGAFCSRDSAAACRRES